MRAAYYYAVAAILACISGPVAADPLEDSSSFTPVLPDPKPAQARIYPLSAATDGVAAWAPNSDKATAGCSALNPCAAVTPALDKTPSLTNTQTAKRKVARGSS